MDILLALLPALFWGSIVLFNVKLGGALQPDAGNDNRGAHRFVCVVSVCPPGAVWAHFYCRHHLGAVLVARPKQSAKKHTADGRFKNDADINGNAARLDFFVRCDRIQRMVNPDRDYAGYSRPYFYHHRDCAHIFRR